VDLTLVVNFTIKDKDDGEKETHRGSHVVESNRLDLDLADRVLKLRFKSSEEASRWKEGLTIWKDYANDNGMYFPSAGVIDPDGAGDDDIESGRQSVSKKKQTRLSDVEVGIPDDDHVEETTSLSPNKKSTAATAAPIISAPLTFGRSSTSNRNSNEERETPPKPAPVSPPVSLPSAPLSEAPPPLQGWLEKKQNGRLGQWQRRYFRVLDSKFLLAYYKTDNPTDTPAGTIDLKLIADVGIAEKEDKSDAARFNIDTGDRIWKLRANNTVEGERWIAGLNAWREHALLSF